jgi:superoxide oxidase
MRDIDNQKYGRVALALHWLMAGLIIFNIASAKFTEDLTREVRSQWLYQHKAIGTILLGLIIWRLIWRLTHEVPPLPSGTTKINLLLAHAGHWTLYGLMIFVPLTGFVKELLRGRDIGLWIFTLPSPFTSEIATSKYLGSLHDVSGNIIMFLVAGHVLMALYHQYFLRDNLINRIAP